MTQRDYTDEERLAATIVASLIYPDYPSGPDLESDAAQCGIYAKAVDLVRDPYIEAAQLMPITGQLYDCPADAATAWEGLRNMSGPATPYARIDPLIRVIGGEIEASKNGAARRALPKNGEVATRPKVKTDYVSALSTVEQPESQIIIERLRTLGYEFKLNTCADQIEVNGRAITDILAAEIRMKLRDIGLAKKLAAAEDAYIAEAKKNSYHPVRDYLDGLVWDKDDHITALADCLTSNDPPVVYRDGRRLALHHVYLYRWLIGAVAKVYTGEQNPMMVWDGDQGIGKSTLARHLCPLEEYFIEGPINVADKDSDIRLLSNWIWEVAELDATTRKADQSALKSFITKQVVTVRKAYGRHDTKKSAMCSLIGTVNNTSGFLADETGSRRFMITKLERIDRRYQSIDVSQIWAQAKALYFDGEPWQLRGEEAAAQAKNNERYQAETILTDWLEKHFVFNPTFDEPYSLADILDALSADNIRLSGSERQQTMELARVLTMKRARKEHMREGKRWFGLQKKNT